jgi:hypothetical protein
MQGDYLESPLSDSVSLGRFTGSLLIPMRVVVVRTQALGVLVLHEKRPLTTVGFDMINVVRGYGPTLNRTFSTLGFLGEPVPSDRFPNR